MKRIILLTLTMMMSFHCFAQEDDILLSFPDVDVSQGGTGEMVVRWNNEMDDVCAFQIDFALPDGFSLSGAQLGDTIVESTPDLKIHFSNYPNGKATVLAFQLTRTPLPKGEYDLMRLTFKADFSVFPDKYDAKVTMIEIGNIINKSRLTNLPSFTLNVTPYDYDAHDIVTDIPDIDVQQGCEAEMTVKWKNKKDDIRSFQFEFTLPEGVHLVDARLGDTLAIANPAFEVVFTDRRESDGQTVIMGYGKDAKPLPCGESDLLHLTVQAEPAAPLGKYTIVTGSIECLDGETGENLILPPRAFCINVYPKSDSLDINLGFPEVNVPQGSKGDMVVTLDNNVLDMRSIQFEFALPEGINLVNMPQSLLQGIVVEIMKHEDGRFAVTCKPSVDGTFPQGKNNLLMFSLNVNDTVSLGKYTITTSPIEVEYGSEGTMTFLSPKSFVLNVIPNNPYAVVKFPDVDVPVGDIDKMVVELDNNLLVATGFQFEFELPEGVRLADAKLGERLKTAIPDMIIQFRNDYPEANNVMVLGWQRTSIPFPKGRYDLMELTFEAEEGMALGCYTVETNRATFVQINEERVSLAPITFHINVVDEKSPVLGDVNGDGVLTFADAICILRWLAGDEFPWFDANLADYDGDGTVTIMDAEAIISYLLGGESTSTPSAKVDCVVDDCKINDGGVELQFGPIHNYTAMMMDVTLPENVSLLDISLDGHHNLSSCDLGGGRLRIAVWSDIMEPLTDNAKLHLNTLGGQVALVVVDNIRLVNMNVHEVVSASFNSSKPKRRNVSHSVLKLTDRSKDMYSNRESNIMTNFLSTPSLNLMGLPVPSKQKGIHIQNGKKIVVK